LETFMLRWVVIFALLAGCEPADRAVGSTALGLAQESSCAGLQRAHVRVCPDTPACPTVIARLREHRCPELSAFGEGCAEDGDCESAVCLQSALGAVCTKPCAQDCPPDWVCRAVEIGPRRLVSLCIPFRDVYCVPCVSDDSCGEPGDRCTPIGGASYCTRDCTSEPCPLEFECAEVGPTFRQCIPVSGNCPGCIDRDQDDYGIGADCLGLDCDDSDPSIRPDGTESCNGRDDNCDGTVDEGCTPSR